MPIGSQSSTREAAAPPATTAEGQEKKPPQGPQAIGVGDTNEAPQEPAVLRQNSVTLKPKGIEVSTELGVLIETVNNARSGRFIEGRKAVLTVVKKSIDERTGIISVCGMGDHPGRFVENKEKGILEEDFKRDLFGNDIGGRTRGEGD